MLMDPSTRPPAMSPSENSSAAAAADPVLLHERRVNRSPLGHSPTTGSSRSSDWKSSLKISRFADELKERSTAPAMVPAARKGESGEKAARADREALFIHAIASSSGDRDLLTRPSSERISGLGFWRYVLRLLRSTREGTMMLFLKSFFFLLFLSFNFHLRMRMRLKTLRDAHDLRANGSDLTIGVTKPDPNR